jgi:hypothetical protein
MAELMPLESRGVQSRHASVAMLREAGGRQSRGDAVAQIITRLAMATKLHGDRTSSIVGGGGLFGSAQQQRRMLLYEAKGIGELSNYIAPQYSDITISTNEGGEI